MLTMESKRISVIVTEELYEILKTLSLKNQRSVSNQVGVLLTEYLKASGLIPGREEFQAMPKVRGGKRQGAGRKPSHREERA
jgi:hypothetical protein